MTVKTQADGSTVYTADRNRVTLRAGQPATREHRTASGVWVKVSNLGWRAIVEAAKK